MTGFAFPESLIAIWTHWKNGDTDAAFESYRHALPSMVYEGQPNVGKALRKARTVSHGWIDCGHVRLPGRGAQAPETEDLSWVTSRFTSEGRSS